MANEKEKKAKEKTPSAIKRFRQSEENRLRNKAFRSKVSSAIRLCKEATNTDATNKLNVVYSLMDKGVKKGIFKKNKANRLKSRITKRILSA